MNDDNDTLMESIIFNETSNNDQNPMSYSLVIDENNSGIFMSNELSAPNEIMSIQKRKIHTWVSDDTTTNCYKCNNLFTYYYRKHHCRACGRIFCYNCCNKFISLNNMDTTNVPEPQTKTIYDIVLDNIYTNESSRVCIDCYFLITESYQIADVYNIIELSFNLKDIHISIKKLNKKWHKASMFYLSKFREIQYKLPFEPFTSSEIKMIDNNKHFFAGHNRLLFQLIMCTNVNDKKGIDYILKLFDEKKKIKCWNLMCSSRCGETFTHNQVCNILTLKQYLPNTLIVKLIPSLDSITDDILDCYFMLMTNRLIEEQKTDEKPLTSYIFNRIKDSLKLSYEFIVCLDTVKLSEDKRRAAILERLKQTYLKDLLGMNKNIYLELIKITGFQQYFDKVVITSYYIKENLTTYVNASAPTHLPFKLDTTYESVDSRNITIKTSKCMPMYIPFKITDTDKYNAIIYKNEDLRQDYVICKAIKRMTHIIKTEVNITTDLVCYDVIPISLNKGLIEVVSDSETVNNITSQGFTIQNYIMEHNKNMTVDEIKNKFIQSTAAYCIITYLLGIEDRHLDNIMIHKSGQLFHIDFGYILGYDPKFSSTYIRITDGMLDAIGGMNSDKYNEFCELCTTMYNTLRVHANIFSCFLLQLNKINNEIYSVDKIDIEVKKRFSPGINKFDGKMHMEKLLEIGHSNTMNQYIINMLHQTINVVRSNIETKLK